MDRIQQLVSEVLHEAADALTGHPLLRGGLVKVGVTLFGSEHGPLEVLRGAEIAQGRLTDAEIVVIGPQDMQTSLKTIAVSSEAEGHRRMEALLASKELDAAVTMHYNFPIGVTTIGLAVTPSRGKPMFIASSTGASAADRTESLVRNAIYGVAAAKAFGIIAPTVGLLNIDGARQAERIIQNLCEAGYPLALTGSSRSDRGLMRGNDLLQGTPDVMVTDTLTGNLLVKVLSAYTTGGNYESVGFGYGPGIGEGYDKIINIISRASGAPVIANSIEYAAVMAKNRLPLHTAQEISAAKRAGLDNLLQHKKAAAKPPVAPPPKKAVTQQISGIDVLELEQAQQLLWQNGIYAETGMGCTGPVVLVAEEDLEKALTIVKELG